MSEEDDNFSAWLSQSMKEMADDEIGEVDPLAALQSIRQRAAAQEEAESSLWAWLRRPSFALGLAAVGAALTFFWIQMPSSPSVSPAPTVAALDDEAGQEGDGMEAFGGIEPGAVFLEEDDEGELAELNEDQTEPVHTLAEPTLLAMDMVDVEEIDAADELVPVVFRSDESTTFLWFEGETKEL